MSKHLTLDEILDHTVFREGPGPNGSGGELLVWMNDEEFTLKQQLSQLIAEIVQPTTSERIPCPDGKAGCLIIHMATYTAYPMARQRAKERGIDLSVPFPESRKA